MDYYIIYFPELKQYYRSKRLLVHHREAAAVYSSPRNARDAVKNSIFADEKFEIIHLVTNSALNLYDSKHF